MLPVAVLLQGREDEEPDHDTVERSYAGSRGRKLTEERVYHCPKLGLNDWAGWRHGKFLGSKLSTPDGINVLVIAGGPDLVKVAVIIVEVVAICNGGQVSTTVFVVAIIIVVVVAVVIDLRGCGACIRSDQFLQGKFHIVGSVSMISRADREPANMISERKGDGLGSHKRVLSDTGVIDIGMVVDPSGFMSSKMSDYQREGR